MPEDITTLLQRGALDRIFPKVYDQLRRIAYRQLRRAWPGQTLDTTALVHEAYIKLIDQTQVQWNDRLHFFAVAATAMRQILVNHAKKKHARKRGGGWHRVTFEEDLEAPGIRARILLELDEALSRLALVDERLSRVVELRFFGGLTEQEIGQLLEVTERTVRRDWVKAKALLSLALSDGESPQA